MIDTYLYVLNHNCQRIHLETFFLVDGLVVRACGIGIGIASLDASRGVSTFVLSFNETTLDAPE